jgi:hypothetical protein
VKSGNCCTQPEPEKGFINLTAFYVVPNGPQRSSVFFNGYISESGLKSMPLAFKLMAQLRPRWAAHLFVHNVFDGDSKILRKCPLSTTFDASIRLQTSVLLVACSYVVPVALTIAPVRHLRQPVMRTVTSCWLT